MRIRGRRRDESADIAGWAFGSSSKPLPVFETVLSPKMLYQVSPLLFLIFMICYELLCDEPGNYFCFRLLCSSSELAGVHEWYIPLTIFIYLFIINLRRPSSARTKVCIPYDCYGASLELRLLARERILCTIGIYVSPYVRFFVRVIGIHVR